jgi:hypothetical protein
MERAIDVPIDFKIMLVVGVVWSIIALLSGTAYRIRFMNSASTPSPWHPPIDISRNPEFRLMDYLAEVEKRIKHKIEQIEEEIDATDERQNTDRLIPKIQTLNWVLNEILVLDKDG